MCFNWQGLVYHAQRDLESSERALTWAIDTNPYKPRFYFNRAETLREMGELSRALQDQNKALELDPGCVEYLHIRGLVHSGLQHY
eukprot:gene28460-35282_t